MQAPKLLFEAIATKKCVGAVYNRSSIKLAPHILYTRHDELYLDAVTVERDAQPPRELKVGTFKIAGLTELTLTDVPFRTAQLFNPDDPKYAGVSLFAVER